MLTGKAGILHLHMGDGERGADLIRKALEISEIPARTFHPTHVNRQPELFEEAMELAKLGCTIDVTCFPVDEQDPALDAADALGRFLDADLPSQRITLSSDSGGCLPTFDGQGHMTHMDVANSLSMAKTLATLFNSGRAPESFLPAFTKNPARLLKLHGRGTLAVGQPADLVVLGDDSLPSSVMIGGQWHLRDGDVWKRGTFEN
jgi:beta-aspartyl-dipeptidase (metallo-type)